jgi:hypothetical protein
VSRKANVVAKTSTSQLFGVPKVQPPPHCSLSRGDHVGPTIVPGPNATYLTSSSQLSSFKHSKLYSNMWILPVLGYVGVVLGFGFLTLAIGMLTHKHRIRRTKMRTNMP